MLKILNQLPNGLTILRVCLAPVIALLIGYSQTALLTSVTLGLFCFSALSDWLDGYLARRLNSMSPMGRMLDPIADKLLIGACLLALAAQRGADIDADNLFLIPAIAIMLREFLVSGLREYLADTQVILPVSIAAKWKTTMQMSAVGMLIAADYSPLFNYGGLVILWLAAGLTVQTGYVYFKASRKYLR